MSEQADQSEKTEDPTAKKLEDALKRGDVAKSQEVPSALMLMAILAFVFGFGPHAADQTTRMLRALLENVHDYQLDGGALAALWHQLGLDLATIFALPFMVLALAAAIGHLIQHRLVFSTEPIKPKLSKISPLAGLKRLFSAEALVNFAKGLIKLGIVSVLMVLVVYGDLPKLETVIASPLAAVLQLTQTVSLKLIAVTVAVMLPLAFLDFLWQRHRWTQKQKMTLKEVRDELKDSDGDPAIKARIRQIRAERGRARMMAAVPEASVVIANPTHFAVALKYDSGMAAPICVAKGVDEIALKIRSVAEEAEVPIVENPPLARLLHASVEVDAPIPEEHYKAVAEVIGFIMRANNTL